MKIFTNKNLIQKVIIAIVCVTVLNFCLAPTIVRADDGTGWGGSLLGPMRDFITAVADTAISVVQLGITGKWSPAVDNKGTGEPEKTDDYFVEKSKFKYPIIQISPELIFANQIRLLDVNFIRGGSRSNYLIDTENTTGIETLRRVIANWYVTLRTIAIVGLLSVLIYIGIRIIISSAMQDKAKYKQRLVDWLIAFCILFFMHYIMAGVLGVIDQVNGVLSQACGLNNSGDLNSMEGIALNPTYGNVKYTLEDIALSDSDVSSGFITFWAEQDDNAIEHVKGLIAANGYTVQDEGPWTSVPNPTGFGPAGGEYVIKCDKATYTISKTYVEESSGSGNSTYSVPKYSYSVELAPDTSTSGIQTTGADSHIYVASDARSTGAHVLYFINYARMYLNATDDDAYIPMAFGYLFIYIVLIVFTVMFAIRYVKRVIYVAFLTLMAPMVALTYPLDKIKDRKSTSI